MMKDKSKNNQKEIRPGYYGRGESVILPEKRNCQTQLNITEINLTRYEITK